MNLPIESKAVEEAVRRAIENGHKTKDLFGTTSTAEMGDAIAAELKKVLEEIK